VKGFRLHVLRNTPLALAVARDMEEVCPEAWLLQYANPMVANIGAITRYTKVKAVGVCHGMPGTIKELCEWMGLDRSKVGTEAIGLNHFIWMTRFRYEGKDAYPMLSEWLRSDAFRAVWETKAWQQRGDTSGPICLDLLERFGLFPCNGDAHMSDYFPWYTSDNERRRSYRTKMHYLENYLKRGDAAWQRIMQLVNDPSTSVSSVFLRRSDEVAVDLIDCLWNGGQGVFELNIPNRGSIPGFPHESALEVPAWVSGDCVQPLQTEGLPYPIAAHVRRRLAEEELQMEAAVQQDRNLLVQAMLLDPYTQSPQQVEGFLNDLAKVEAPYAPWLC
jgi:alpha-galactosidase